ncbi:hypothetical protein F442_22866, partial [Phytophthora nicotianae P10297]
VSLGNPSVFNFTSAHRRLLILVIIHVIPRPLVPLENANIPRGFPSSYCTMEEAVRSECRRALPRRARIGSQSAACSEGSSCCVRCAAFVSSGSIRSYTKDIANFFKQAAYGYSNSKSVLNNRLHSICSRMTPWSCRCTLDQRIRYDAGNGLAKARGHRVGRNRSHHQAKPREHG